MSSNVNFVNSVHVGSSVAVATVDTPLGSLLNGQMALVEASSMKALNAAGAQALSSRATVYIATGLGDGKVRLSAPIRGDLVTNYAGTSYTAPVQKNLQVGVQGSSYVLPVSNETEYQLNILINDDQRPHGQKQTRETYHYTTDANATSGEVVFSILSLFGMKFGNGAYKKYGNRFVTMGAISDVTAGAVGVGEDITFTYGSKIASVATTPTLVEGDYLEVTANDIAGVSKTYHYLIVRVDATNDIIELDTPFAQESGTVLVANTGTYTQATADGAEYAFDIVALKPSEKWNGIDEYEVVDFEASYYATDNAGADGAQAPVKVIASGKAGAGTGYQIHDLEYHAQGYRGVNSRTRWFDSKINPDTEADVSKSYDLITVVFDGKQRSDFGDLSRPKQMANIALIDGSTQATGFVAILNGYFSTVLGFDAVTL